ncbi:hypothetical protein FHL15_005771 [Xylaria flabelliformis]|uniref:Uncharacterized protein n=1 Tax=Xylaria flabelliformis TaxID=2512241 RepID=A0A553HZ04_9PEZI|nr:hypothetical protein FHL15_005771 [Xylaria flabelliformis]
MPARSGLLQQAAALMQRGPTRAPRTLPTSNFFRPNPAVRARYNRRGQSTNSNSKPPPSDPTSIAAAPQSRRISRILAGASRFMPRRLRGALQDLRSAPLSHIFAFLALHEITAILPIFGLTYIFHTLNVDIPANWMVTEDGLNKWTNYFRKQRWFGLEPIDDGLREETSPRRDKSTELMDQETKGLRKADPQPEEPLSPPTKAQGLGETGDADWRSRFWKVTKNKINGTSEASVVEKPGNSQSKEVGSLPPDLKRVPEVHKTGAAKMPPENMQKILVQVAAAYAITKMLLVPRIALSLWLTPWLARGFVGFRQALRRKRR